MQQAVRVKYAAGKQPTQCPAPFQCISSCCLFAIFVPSEGQTSATAAQSESNKNYLSLSLSLSHSLCALQHRQQLVPSPFPRYKPIPLSLSRLTLFDIPLSSSLLLPNTVKNFDFNAPILGVRSINNLIFDLSPANAAGGVPGVAVGGGLASTMLIMC